MVINLDYQEIIARRRALVIEPYKSLAEIEFDGPWVTPYQIISKSTEGPVLVALHWLGESSILRERDKLQHFGYLPNIRFNTVLDLALGNRGLSRSDVYVTRTFHLIPGKCSERILQAAIRRSFAEVTRFELEGRKVIASIRKNGVLQAPGNHDTACHLTSRYVVLLNRAMALS